MEYEKLQDLFWDVSLLLARDLLTEPADQHIRWKYPTNGQPDWKIDDNILFLFLSEQEDDYGKQVDTTREEENGSVTLKRTRTRVWSLLLTAYGPKACEIVNRIKDGVFRQDAKKLLADGSVFLVPDLPACQNAPELYAGKWWNRWDLTLHFNELYSLPDEDAGHIDSVAVTGKAEG